MTFLTVVPAYGRDYTTAKAVKEDWAAGKDFRINDISSRWDGKVINNAQQADMTIMVRFNGLRKTTTITPGGEAMIHTEFRPEMPGVVRVVVPDTKVGDIAFTIGGPDSEFVRVTPDEGYHPGGTFLWRGRKYSGVLMLRRDNFTTVYNYGWMLKDAKGASASTKVYWALSKAVSAIVTETLDKNPAVLQDAIRTGLENQLAHALKASEKAAQELADANQAVSDLRDRLNAHLKEMLKA